MKLREYLTDTIGPLLPTDWAWIPEQREPDTITRPTVILKHAKIERLPAAPVGHLLNTVALTVYDPRQDRGVEDSLDDHVLDMLSALDSRTDIRLEEATKVLHPSRRYLGWDIRLTVITQKEA